MSSASSSTSHGKDAGVTGEPLEPPAVKPKRSLPRRVARSLFRIFVVAYFGLVIVLAALQTQIIFPGAASQGRRDAVVRPFDGGEIVQLKASTGDTVAALFGGATLSDGSPHPDAARRPTLVYFYGNGMCMADCAGDWAKLRRRGFNVIVPDYLGYGMSGGKPSEQGVYATADAVFDHLLQRPDVDPKRIVPMGWSLGGGAAVHLATTRQVPALVLVSAFTSIPDMGRRHFPYLPTRLFIVHRFENEKKLRGIRCPVFIAHGTRDGIIPFDMSARNAAAATSAGVKVVKYDVTDGDHNDVFDVGGEELGSAIAAFVNDNAGKN